MEDKFDLIIIGGGASAFAAAIQANEYQAKTLMINSGLPLGGTCVNVGCVPSKNLLSVGDFKYNAEHPRFGSVKIPAVEFDFAHAIDEELQIVDELRQIKYSDVLSYLEHVTLVDGRARFVSPQHVQVSGQRFYGERFIVAVGSTARPPAIPGINDVGYITHIDALRLKQQPRRLLVLGAGPVALEFAQMFRHFGSEVTIVVRGDRLYKRTEPEISAALEEYLREEGIAIQKSATVKQFCKEGDQKIAMIQADGRDTELSFDELLIGTGKIANTEGLGLEVAGVQTNQDPSLPHTFLSGSSSAGQIRVNPWYQTNIPYIYAAGDCADLPKRLETTAGKEGSFAAINALTGANKKKIDYDLVPSVAFTYPAVADVGILDDQVGGRGIQCYCGTVYFDKLPKSKIIKDTRGAIKMVAEQKTDRIVGVHMVAPHAEEIINEAMYILRAHMTIDDVIDSLTVFPTISESIKLAALSFRTDIDRVSCCI